MMMKTKLLFGIFLILVSMIGVGCVSAADNQTSIQTNVEDEINLEMAKEKNLIQTQSESVNQVEKSANTIGLSNNGIQGNWPFHNGIKDHTNIKHDQTIKSGVNNTNNSNNKTIKGPKTNGSNLNISGPK